MKLPDAADREQAVTDLEHNLVVTAGAGTGKTSLMVERALYLLLQAGAPLTELALITFTEKAAAELRERLEDGLERVLEIAGSDSPLLDHGREADRIYARLDLETREQAVARARHALDDLDHATVGTIHSLAGAILRRNHRAAGVDVHFQVDADEMAYDELFRELWAKFLDDTLKDDQVSDAWEEVLDRFGIDEVETASRELCRLGDTGDILGEHARETQLAYAGACARSLLDDMEQVRIDLADAGQLNENFIRNLDTLDRVLSQSIEARSLPSADEISSLTKEPTPGRKSGVRDLEAVKKRLATVRERALRLAGSDLEIATRLGRLVGEFTREFRREYLRRGQVSYDALIRLSRDMLRDNLRVRRSESRLFRQLLVDEFQDTDPLQYEIVLFLATDPDSKCDTRDAFQVDLAAGKLFIVGDAKQSIYRFRGADIDAYHRAVETLRRGGGRVLTLRTNFRSTRDLIAPLNRLFARYFTPGVASNLNVRDPHFDALEALRVPPPASATPGPAIEVWSVGDRRSRAPERRQMEAGVLAAWLDQELRTGRFSARDVALLFRALSEVDVYLRELRRYRIPYLMEGGRGFFRRYEVELLLACLRMVRNPADPIALVSCLRSPIGAVPDTELQLYAREAPAECDAWNLEARPDPRRFPALAGALERFRAFSARHRLGGIDRLAHAALDELPLRLAMSASYEGAQRVANLEKAVLHISVLAHDGRWSAEDILGRIEREDAAEKQEADSPLADEGVDAVRVLSIHKSKGLEWPVVVLPDLSREHGAPRGAALHVGVAGTVGLPRALALRMHGVETPAHLWHSEVGKAQERAEAKRLFYVATTRARDRLVLMVGGCRELSRGRCDWVEALRDWGYDPDAAFASDDAEGLRELRDAGVLHRRGVTCAPPSRRVGAEQLDDVLLVAARRLEEARRAEEARGREKGKSAGGLSDAPLEAPSRAHAPPGDPGTPRQSAEPAGDVGRFPRAIHRAAGAAVHLLLEAWDGREVDWLRANTERAVAVAVGYGEIDRARVLETVNGLLENAITSGQIEALMRSDVLGTELPLLYRDEDGTLWDGAIDLVVRSRSSTPPPVEVLDYKTDRADSAAVLEERYGNQLGIYARGLREALGLDELPRTRIVWLGKTPSPKSRE